MKEDIPTKFWKEYIKLDCLDRRDHIKQIVKAIDDLRCIKEDRIRKSAMTTTLISYFDDLVELIK